MSQRTLAGLLAVPLLAALWLSALFVPLPYVTYEPGLTVDVLGEQDGRELVQVSGHPEHRADGELRLTTVLVSRPGARVNLFEVLAGWLDRDDAVLPYEAVYAPDTTREQAEFEGAVQMVSSQDAAVAAALRLLGHEVTEAVEVLSVDAEMPAAGKLEVGDVLVRVGDREVSTAQDVVEAVEAVRPGEPLEFVVRRAGEEQQVSVVPADVDGAPRVGIAPGPGFEFPFEVSVGVDSNIGGSSAGLVFALAVYDTLTPGSLVDGEVVAGSGTMSAAGEVGPIGGISQKIAAAREDDARLFLVPPGNCAEAVQAEAGDMRLVRADTLQSTVEALQTWSEDREADLPTCERNSDG